MPRLLAQLFIAASTFLLPAHGGAAPDGIQQAVAIQCGSLLEVENEVVLNDVTIIVEGERIKSIVDGMAAPEDALVVDLSGKTCLPGLMDMHAHMMIAPFPVPLGEGNSAMFSLQAAANIKEMLYSGFTTLRLPGDWDNDFGIVEVRNAVNQGTIPGPRMFVAGHKLGFERYMRKNGKEVDAGYHAVGPGVEGVREAVRTQVDHGVDWVKFIADSGNLKTEGVKRIFNDEEVAAFIEEAHRLNTPITAHAIDDEASYLMAVSGVDTIEHGFYISEATAEEIKKRDIWLVPTLTVLDMFDDDKLYDEADDWLKASIDATRDIHVENKVYRDASFKYAYKIGVKIAYGTDMIWPKFSKREFVYLVRLGVSNWDAVKMATINSAQLLGMEEEIGSVRAGKYADIIALEGDPLADIEAVESTVFVMKAGEIIRHDGAAN